MILTVTLNAAIDKRYVVENFNPGAVYRIKECSYSAGGKGLNVARVASIAGEEVLATGFVGGHAGSYIIEQLKAQNIQSDFVHISGESRSCINIYDEINKSQTEFLEPGVYVTDENKEAMLSKYNELLNICSVVAISGSVPDGVDSSLYKEMIIRAKQQNKKVLLDTSGNILREAIDAKPTMIKPNTDEIKLLAGKELVDDKDMVEMAISLHDSGIEIVAISCGADGSIIACDEGVYRAYVPKVRAINTVGCGDSMIAGFAIGLSRNMKMVDIIKLSSAISAANAMRVETGFYVKEDMEAILPHVKVSKIK